MIIEIGYGKKIEYIVRNSRLIEITTNTMFTQEEKIHNDIKKIIFSEEFSIEANTNFRVIVLDKEIDYFIKYIEKINNHTYLLYTDKINKSSIYLLPTLGYVEIDNLLDKNLSKVTLEHVSRFCKESYLINCYIDKDNYSFLKLKYRFLPHETYRLFEKKLTNHPYFAGIEDIKDIVIVKFKIPETYENIVELFLEGKYSQFSERYKRQILAFYKSSKDSKLGKILYRDEALRDEISKELGFELNISTELESIPTLEEEVL